LAAHLASHLFSPCLLVVHDAYTGGQNDLPELQRHIMLTKPHALQLPGRHTASNMSRVLLHLLAGIVRLEMQGRCMMPVK